jgi:hypothetical protein
MCRAFPFYEKKYFQKFCKKFAIIKIVFIFALVKRKQS